MCQDYQITKTYFDVSAGCMDSWIFMFSKMYNVDKDVFIFPFDQSIVISFQDVACFTDSTGVYHEMVRLVKRVQDLDLTEEEAVVSSALCLMVSGRYAMVLSLGYAGKQYS